MKLNFAITPSVCLLVWAGAVPWGMAQGQAVHETVAGGEVTIVPIHREGGIPLPNRAPQEAGAQEDRALGVASGDPFFLGFAGGNYHPPVGERIDPLLLSQLRSGYTDGRPGAETWAFVMFQERITDARLAELEDAGARVLGFHPHYSLRVALSPDAVVHIAALDFVRWVGVPRPWQKVHPVLKRELAAAGAGAAAPSTPLALVVNVFESDLGPDSTAERFGSFSVFDEAGPGHSVSAGPVPDGSSAPEALAILPERTMSHGWQQHGLESQGLAVRAYQDRVRSFRVQAFPGQIEALAELDWVQFLELDLTASPFHEESMPMVNADLARTTYDGNASFSAVVGIVDSGVHNTHDDLSLYGAGWDLTGEGNPWDDSCGHGSHVVGTMLGRGVAANQNRGVAPGLASRPYLRLFNVKVFPSCAPAQIDQAAVIDILNDSFPDLQGNTTVQPHVVNNSWGSTTLGPYFGSESDARMLDAHTYLEQQLLVFSAGNDGPGGQSLSLQASAKNTFAVGNVNTTLNGVSGYPGNLFSSSSRGPTADLRWGPQISAPGSSINSVLTNTSDGYIPKTGTSMAAPHVAGVAGQLVDRHPFLRNNAATLGAVLMAGSLQKDGQLLGAPSIASTHHYNLYGAGRIDAVKAAGSNSQQAMSFWGFSQGASGFGQLDFTVQPGATQLTVVMYYHEYSASAGASSALRNDLDMYIDRFPFSIAGNSGEYSAHQSSRDNTEMRVISNPQATDYRIKIFPENVPAGFFSTSKVGVCVIVTYGDVTPDATLSVVAGQPCAQPDEDVEFTASYYNPSYIASGVYLETSTSGILTGATTTLADGAVADLSGNGYAGGKVLLGNVLHQKTRAVTWTKHWSQEGVKNFQVTASSDNAGVDAGSASVIIDGTPPVRPTLFASTSHPTNASLCDGTIDLVWTPGSDSLSGLAGYRLTGNHSPTSEPGGLPNRSAGDTSTTVTVLPDAQPWYFHLVAIDCAGNRAPALHAGPFMITGGGTVSYCQGAINSAGTSALMSSTGSTSIAANNLVLRAGGVPPNKPGLFFFGTTAIQVPFGDGFRCAGGPTRRMGARTSNSSGVATQVFNHGTVPGSPISPGSTRRFQFWYRDPMGPGGTGFNLSNGLAVSFCE